VHVRTVGQRWLAPIAAALLLLAGAGPATAAAAPSGSAAASALTGRPGPDDAVHAGRADHGDRAGITERAVDGAVAAFADGPSASSVGTAPIGRRPTSSAPPGGNEPRAPPVRTAPVPS